MDENVDTGDGDICASFTQLLKGIQTETNVLKCVSQLRTLPPDDKITEKIFAMERAVQEIERNFEDFNEFLSSEMNTCDMMEKDIIVLAEQQELRIEELRRSLPQSLADAVSSFKATALSSKDQSVILEVVIILIVYQLEDQRGITVFSTTTGLRYCDNSGVGCNSKNHERPIDDRNN
jgi:hypothetical protein